MGDELKLEVFISWSGPRAGAVAKELKSWLEVALQFTRPFLSKDIVAGKRWSTDLAEALDRSNFGILVLTPENVASEWLLFEAGALAKHLGRSHVVPLLIEMQATDLRLPLSDFQAVRLADQLFDLATALNAAQPDPWPVDTLRKAFEWTHKRFLDDTQRALLTIPAPEKSLTPPRSTEDLLEEVLSIVKSLRTPNVPSLPAEDLAPLPNEQYYPVNDRILLYKFLKGRVTLPLYRYASMPTLFDAAARFIQSANLDLNSQESLAIVAKYLVSERPLMDLLDGLRSYEGKP